MTPTVNPESWPSPPPPPAPVVLWPRTYVPVATYVLIALNVAVFALMIAAGGPGNSYVVLDFGASYEPFFRQGQYWRLVMPMFLHLGWLHLGTNMFVLFILGPVLEEMYGYGRFLLLYVGAGICGSFASMTISHNVAAGASGAIMGVAGAILVAGYVHRATLPHRLARVFSRGRLPFMLLIFVVMELVVDRSIPNVDHWGHVGGLVGGALLALLIAPPRRESVAGHWLGGTTASAALDPSLRPPEGPEERPSQSIAVVPVAVVALAMTLAAGHYQSFHRASLLLQQGDRLEAVGSLDRAIASFRQAEKLAPNDERPHEDLGLAYAAKAQVSDAAAEYEQALRLNPRSLQAALGLASIYQSQGKPAESQKLIETALGKDPQSAGAQAELADLANAQKLYPQAIGHYQQALRLDPRLAVAHNNLAWLYATCDDPKFRNAAEALEHAKLAVELTEWRQPEFIDTLAEAYYATGNYAQAVETQKKALALAPHAAELQEHMAKYRKARSGVGGQGSGTGNDNGDGRVHLGRSSPAPGP